MSENELQIGSPAFDAAVRAASNLCGSYAVRDILAAYEAAKPLSRPDGEAIAGTGGVAKDAIGFINDLVHMQSGQGWTRSVVREAAAAFLMRRGIAITGHSDTSASIAALAASIRGTVERVDAGWQTIKDQCHEGSDSGFTEQAAGELFEAIETLTKLFGRSSTGWDLVPVVDDAWQELCEQDDRTSPAEYPDMRLITHNELADFMSRASLANDAPPIAAQGEAALRAIAEGENHTAFALRMMARDALRSLATPPAPACAPEPAAVEAHPDDLAVDRFATAMKAKLAKKRREGRSGWDDKDACSTGYLTLLLVEHVKKGDPVDIGNFAMMLHQRGEVLADDRER